MQQDMEMIVQGKLAEYALLRWCLKAHEPPRKCTGNQQALDTEFMLTTFNTRTFNMR